MKFRIRCENQTRVVEIESNALTTVNDLKGAILTSAFAHLSLDIQLSLNGSTPLQDEATLSDSGLVHGDTIYVIIPPGVTCDISPSSSSTSNQMNEGTSCSTSTSSSGVEVGMSNKQITESHNCNIDEGRLSETMMACGDAGVVQDNADVVQDNADVVLINADVVQGNAGVVQDNADVVQDDVAMQTDEGATDVAVNRYLNEPMLIRESTAYSLPQSLVKLCDELKAPGSFRAVAAVLKVLMNELGYLEQDKGATVTDIREWTGPKVLKMDFVYPVLDATSFSLLLVPMHGTLMIHGRCELFDSDILSVRIQVEVSEVVNVRSVSDDPHVTYRGEKLPNLSRAFKDTIAYPMLQFALAGSGFCAKPGLSTLALELQMEIMKRLDVKSLVRLSEVCHQLHNATQDRSVWRRMFLKDFGASQISIKDLTEDWKSMYKRRYASYKAWKKPVKFWIPEPSFPPILPIGGEYDLNPFFPDPRPPMCMGGPVMFPFSEGSSLDARYDECMLPPPHLALRKGHPSDRTGGPFGLRF